MGAKIIKQGSEALVNRSGASDFVWPCFHIYILDVNNYCASLFLGLKTPNSKQHGYTPDISGFLLYMFCEAIYFKAKDKCPESNERKGRWHGDSNHVGDLLTYFIYCKEIRKVVLEVL